MSARRLADAVRQTHPHLVPREGYLFESEAARVADCIEDLQRQLLAPAGHIMQERLDRATAYCCACSYEVSFAAMKAAGVSTTDLAAIRCPARMSPFITNARGYILGVDPGRPHEPPHAAPPAAEPCICVGPRARACRAHPEEP